MESSEGAGQGKDISPESIGDEVLLGEIGEVGQELASDGNGVGVLWETGSG